MTPRVFAHRYRVDALLGRGGMGVVHRGTDLELERPVAIKVLASVQDAAMRERFLVEAKRTASIRHPNVVEVFDVGRDEGETFIVMELLEGETLEVVLERASVLSVERMVRVGAQICDALAAAHDARIVHRDLKPANVFLVATPDDEPRVKLLDFGIAKRVDGKTARTDPGMLVGTLEYMAPEQMLGGEIDGRADLYALGLLLRRAITGVSAFDADNVGAMMYQHMNVMPGPLPPSIPNAVDVDLVLARFYAKDRADRFENAREAKRALLTLVGEGEPFTSSSRLAAATSPSGVPSGKKAPSGSMREFELDPEDAGAPSLELELPAPSPSAPTSGGMRALVPRVPSPPMSSEPASRSLARPVPAWAAPFASVPASLGKRVLVYSLGALVLYNVLFSATLGASLMLGFAALVGGLCMWANQRFGQG